LRHFTRRALRCDSCTLDAQQKEVVAACEDVQLVLASAGSGKTLSLLAKIEYLYHKLRIPAEQILIISFTSKTVAELKERCRIKGVEIRTFHSLGNHLLRNSGRQSQSLSLVDDPKIKAFIRKYCEFLIVNDANFARDVVDYILFFHSTPQSPDSPRNFSAKISFNRLYLRKNIGQQRVFSKEEQLIANWLTIHGLKYVCNRAHPKEPKYKPNFTIQAPQKIYVNHVIIDKNNKSIFGSRYLREMKWRRQFHERQHDNYIFLPSWRWNDWSIFDYLKSELARFRIEAARRPDAEIYHELLRGQTYRLEITGFYDMLQTFLSLHKNSARDDSYIKEHLQKDDEYSHLRSATFLRIYFRVFRAYEKYLFHTKQYDFADMINVAKQCVDEISECALGYRYILLDEVQDLSRNRLLLIRSILDKNPGCKLFAVGDDWQSIYRFTGSDLAIIRDFGRIFHRETRRGLIESTHRFGQPTIKLSSDFIQRNSAQSRKNVQNTKTTATPIYAIMNRPTRLTKGQDAKSLQIILQELIAKHGYEKISAKTIQIISRYNHDINRLDSDLFEYSPLVDASDVYEVVWSNPQNPEQKLRLEFCSMHKSKGITRDIVIVLNMNSDIMGMPATRETDPILDTLLPQEDNYLFAEERRLFYVAITRAREATYLIANRKNPSPFIFEISENIRAAYGKLCPKCRTGELIHKHGRHGDFYYCSNYVYGCDYLKRA